MPHNRKRPAILLAEDVCWPQRLGPVAIYHVNWYEDSDLGPGEWAHQMLHCRELSWDVSRGLLHRSLDYVAKYQGFSGTQ